MPDKYPPKTDAACENSPRVVVGLPVYNGAMSVDQALEALSRQTYPHFTVLVSDNASTDDTWEVLQKWARRDARIRPYRQNTNIGHTQNFQYVLDQADTPYFTWHASDDWVSRDYLQELVRVVSAHPQCGFVAPRIIHVNRAGAPVGEIPFPLLSEGSRIRRIRQLLSNSQGHRVYGLFRTDLLREAKAVARDFGYVWGWDALVQLAFILNDRMCGTNDAVLYYRLNEGFSLKLYKPRPRHKLLAFWARYLRFHVRLWRVSSLPLLDRLACFPWLLYHSIDSLRLRPVRDALKLTRRFARRSLKAIFVHPIGTILTHIKGALGRRRTQQRLLVKRVRAQAIGAHDPIAVAADGQRSTAETFASATAQIAGGDLDRAEKLLLKLLEDEPAHASALHNLGLLYLERERHEEATAALRKAVDLSPDRPDLLTGLGLGLQISGHTLQAQNVLMKALAIKPDHHAAYKEIVDSIAEEVIQGGEQWRQSQTEHSDLEPDGENDHRISIIICSIDGRKQASVTEHYERLLADTAHELIVINDARSLCEGYNRGIERSTGQILVFSHDDIDIVSPDFSRTLRSHLGRYDIVGVAGTDRLVDPFWGSAGWPHLHGQVIHERAAAGHYKVVVFGLEPAICSGVQAIDGLLLAVNRDVVDRLRFDQEHFTGFHFYDIDFSYSAFLAGFRIAVCNDIVVMHASTAQLDASWRHDASIFARKFSGQFAPPSPEGSKKGVVSVDFRQRAQAVEFCQRIVVAGHRIASERADFLEQTG